MIAAYPSCVYLLLICYVQCALCDVEYDLIKQGQNPVTLTCRNKADGLSITPHVTWYFNGSLHTTHPCTVNATLPNNSSITILVTPECQGYVQCGDSTKDSVSLPLLLETEPVLISGASNGQLKVVEGDTVVIPCGIRISSIGNFKITWYGFNSIIITDPKIGPDYSLTLSGEKLLAADYLCTASSQFKDGTSSSPVFGLKTTVEVFEYERPKISDIDVSIADDDTVMLMVTAQGTADNKYAWVVNGRNITDGADSMINPTSPILKLPSINNKDSILVRVMNTDVRDGTTVTDTGRAFIFATATSTNNKTCFATVTPLTDSVEPVMFEMITYGLLGIIALLMIVIIVSLFMVCYFCYKRTHPTTDEQEQNGIVTVKICDEHDIKFDVQKMNKNMDEFFSKIDLIIGKVVDQVDEVGKERLSAEIKTQVWELKGIIANWIKEKNKTKVDCSGESPPPYPCHSSSCNDQGINSSSSGDDFELNMGDIPEEYNPPPQIELNELASEPVAGTQEGANNYRYVDSPIPGNSQVVDNSKAKTSFSLLFPKLDSCVHC